MAKKLKRRIQQNNILSSLLLSLLIGISSMAFFTHTFYTSFVGNAEESIKQQISTSTFSIDAVKNSTMQLSNNNTFIDKLDSTIFDFQVEPQLNTLRNSSFGIYAVSIYMENGIIYNSANINSLLSLDTFKDSSHFAPIFVDHDESFLSIRTNEIAGFYDNFPYNDSFGMITYVVAINNEGKTIGYMFVDIKPSYYYDNFFRYEGHESMMNTESFLIDDNNQFLRHTNNSETTYLKEIFINSPLTKDFKHIKYEHTLFDNYRLETFVPTSYLINEILRTSFYIIIIIIFVNVATYGISRYFGKKLELQMKQVITKTKETRSIE